MHSNPDSVLMLAEIRHCELQGEAARIWFAREAYGSGFQSPGIAALHRLRTALGRAGELLRDSGLTQVRPRRGAEAS